jgi:hypothetical protein
MQAWNVNLCLSQHYPSALGMTSRPQHPYTPSYSEDSLIGLTVDSTNDVGGDSNQEGQHPSEQSCGPANKKTKMMHWLQIEKLYEGKKCLSIANIILLSSVVLP